VPSGKENRKPPEMTGKGGRRAVKVSSEMTRNSTGNMSLMKVYEYGIEKSTRKNIVEVSVLEGNMTGSHEASEGREVQEAGQHHHRVVSESPRAGRPKPLDIRLAGRSPVGKIGKTRKERKRKLGEGKINALKKIFEVASPLKEKVSFNHSSNNFVAFRSAEMSFVLPNGKTGENGRQKIGSVIGSASKQKVFVSEWERRVKICEENM
jgi:hypothetical protein